MINYKKRKHANAKYNAALLALNDALNKLQENYPQEKELYNAAKDIMVVANAVKKHHLISNPDDTHNMTKVLNALTTCLNDPEFKREETIADYERAADLTSQLPATAPFKWPIMAILRVCSFVSMFTGAIAEKYLGHNIHTSTAKEHPSTFFKRQLASNTVEDLNDMPSFGA